MRTFSPKLIVIAIIVLALLGAGVFFVFNRVTPVEPTADTEPQNGPVYKVIGISVEGRSIDSYTYGAGDTHIAFVGGVHGGYEWNSVLLAYTFIDYLDANPDFLPTGMTVTVIPSANPDGLYKVTGRAGRFNAIDASTDEEVLALGRFNANAVDINRNFDCKWKPKSMWRSQAVNAGSAPFSEPEAKAIRDFVLTNRPEAVIFWHSQSNAVYASECENGILPQTLDIMNAYSRASGYPAVKTFDAYEITGDSEGWLASINIPAITVELKTHKTIEWEQNLAGIKAIFEYFGNSNQ